jgi:thioredoxin-related protein
MKRLIPLALMLTVLLPAISCAGNKKAPVPAGSVNFAQSAFKASFEQAQREGKFVMVDFYTEWCKWCKVLDEKTYPDPAVKKIMDESFVFEKYNPEEAPSFTHDGKNYGGADVAKAFNVRGYPTVLFMEKDGTVIGALPGFVPPEVFVKILGFITSREYQKTKFDDFLNSL